MIGEVQGLGKYEDHKYSLDVATHMHSGTNLFRVMQIDHKGAHFSPELKAESKAPVATLQSEKVTKTIDFSTATDYEVYSEYGTLVKTGHDKSIDISAFFKGKYYINFDSKTGSLVEKK